LAAPPLDSAFRFEVIAEHTADWQFWVREEGSIEYISSDCERISGFSRAELASGAIRLRDYVHPEDYPAVRALYAEAMAGKERHNVVFRIRRKDGGTRWGSLSFLPVRDGSGRSFGFRGSIRDVTSTKEAEEAHRREREALHAQLLQAQKMETMGELAGGIAHEFNNLLTGILGFTSLLQARAAAGSPEAKALGMIEKSASQAATLTRQLLGFARKEPLRAQEVGVNGVVAEVLSIVRTTFDRSIAIREELDPALWTVEGDPGRLAQALLNICINARDAMNSAGTLSIRTANVETGARRTSSLEAVGPGRHVLLSVRDSGCGIDPSIRSRIFEPFFTTKEQGKGTGMGLAVVYGIVKDHRGAIDLESAPGAGTEVRLYLPAKGG
jgi:two-component system, cell cycle sensor histidine kinase and response regulator CckA